MAEEFVSTSIWAAAILPLAEPLLISTNEWGHIKSRNEIQVSWKLQMKVFLWCSFENLQKVVIFKTKQKEREIWKRLCNVRFTGNANYFCTGIAKNTCVFVLDVIFTGNANDFVLVLQIILVSW